MKPSETSGGFFFQKSFVFLWRIKKEFYLWVMNNTQTHLMTSRRHFAIALSKGPVQVQSVSKKLDRIVALWMSRKEIKLTNGTYELA